MMPWDLLVGAVLYLLGWKIFGPFEAKTGLPRRAIKIIGFFGLAAWISHQYGKVWSLAYFVIMFGIGIAFHAWWTHRNGISFWRPEPKAKYYRLRGWPLDDEVGPKADAHNQ